ncbi:hypothetical protein DOY81_014553 [Sarcophaga bullata]|nr:hypothetical protein DOY81_014553 [Sarcophaga bullata]
MGSPSHIGQLLANPNLDLSPLKEAIIFNPYGLTETCGAIAFGPAIEDGNVGQLYPNTEGDLYIIDRKKDILKYNNYHFSPSEIEAVILELPDVVEVCVFGVPDIYYTFLPAAAIIKRSGSSLTGEEVSEHVKERMTHFKQLRGGVYFVNELPRTPSGKILRRKMAELCQSLNKEL